MNGLDLFSGIGGITLALAPWVRPIAYCENERYAQSVLLSRIADGHLPSAPIWDDVRTLRACYLPAPIDIIYGGFPCQNISTAGAGGELEGKRSGLFFELLRLVDECRPGWVFLENVAAIRTRGADRVTETLSSLGYDCRWTTLRASDVGAPHQRNRWWLLAYNPYADRSDVPHGHGHGLRIESGRISGQGGQGTCVITADGANRYVAHSDGFLREGAGGVAEQSTTVCGSEICDTDSARPQERQGECRDPREEFEAPFRTDWWSSERGLGRVADGLPHRVDRLRCLGNAVVPAQARKAFQILAGLET